MEEVERCRRIAAEALKYRLKKGLTCRGPCFYCGTMKDICAIFTDLLNNDRQKLIWSCRKHKKFVPMAMPEKKFTYKKKVCYNQ